MPVLTQTPMTGPGQRIATPNTLTSSDTFSYTYGAGQILVLWNNIGGSISPRFKGTTAADIPIPGYDNVAGGPGANG